MRKEWNDVFWIGERFGIDIANHWFSIRGSTSKPFEGRWFTLFDYLVRRELEIPFDGEWRLIPELPNAIHVDESVHMEIDPPVPPPSARAERAPWLPELDYFTERADFIARRYLYGSGARPDWMDLNIPDQFWNALRKIHEFPIRAPLPRRFGERARRSYEERAHSPTPKWGLPFEHKLEQHENVKFKTLPGYTELMSKPARKRDELAELYYEAYKVLGFVTNMTDANDLMARRRIIIDVGLFLFDRAHADGFTDTLRAHAQLGLTHPHTLHAKVFRRNDFRRMLFIGEGNPFLSCAERFFFAFLREFFRTRKVSIDPEGVNDAAVLLQLANMALQPDLSGSSQDYVYLLHAQGWLGGFFSYPLEPIVIA